MAESIADKSPNDALAEIVLEKLAGSGFIPTGKEKEVGTKIAAGTATREDWLLWVELAQAKKKEGTAS